MTITARVVECLPQSSHSCGERGKASVLCKLYEEHFQSSSVSCQCLYKLYEESLRHFHCFLLSAELVKGQGRRLYLASCMQGPHSAGVNILPPRRHHSTAFLTGGITVDLPVHASDDGRYGLPAAKVRKWNDRFDSTDASTSKRGGGVPPPSAPFCSAGRRRAPQQEG